MSNVTLKIALPIILAGLFIIIAFTALNYNRLDTNFYIVISVVIIYVFLFSFAVGQNFATPIRKILERAIEITRGNLSSRVYLETKDELEELAKVLNEIADKFEEDKTAIETTEKGVDIKVKARTEALEETITALEQKVKNRTLELEKMMSDSQKLQQDTKTKEAEIAGMRKEIADLKEGAGPKAKRKLKTADPEVKQNS